MMPSANELYDTTNPDKKSKRLEVRRDARGQSKPLSSQSFGSVRKSQIVVPKKQRKIIWR